jgi:hypothetical protein
MKQLGNWFLINNLAINTEKTKVMLFQGKQLGSNIRPNLHFRKKELNNASNSKFLGIYSTENLKWYTHIQYLRPNLSYVFYVIKSLQDTVSLPILRNIYFTKFHLILRYGIIFWVERGKWYNRFYTIKEGS